jgi:hypothetical protein
MIAGVQGDFTRSLVSKPPKTLWTRELKVRYSFVIFLINPLTLSSLLVYPIRQRYTNAVSASAQEPVLALLFPHVSNHLTGKSLDLLYLWNEN